MHEKGLISANNMSIYAVIHTGGKQYRVSPGDRVRVEKLTAQPGDRIELDQVYLLAVDGHVMAGNPVLKNTRVVTEVLDQDRDKKIIVFKHKRRKGYRKTTGHRQYFTELKIIGIIHEGASYREQPEKQRQSQKNEVIATALVDGKAEAAQQRATGVRRTESRPDEQKQEKQITGKPAPQQPEKQKPPEQIAPESTSIIPAAAPQGSPKEEPSVRAVPRQPEKQNRPEQTLAPESIPIIPAAVTQGSLQEETSVPAVPSPEPERPQPLAGAAPSEQSGNRESMKKQDEKTSGKRGLWWIIAIIAALVLLGLVPLIGNHRPAPRPETGQKADGKPAPEKPSKESWHRSPGSDRRLSKTKPPLREVKTKETVRVDKPTAPAQPPD